MFKGEPEDLSCSLKLEPVEELPSFVEIMNKVAITSISKETSQQQVIRREDEVKRESTKVVTPLRLRKVSKFSYVVKPKPTAGRSKSGNDNRQPRPLTPIPRELIRHEPTIIETHHHLFQGNYCFVHRREYHGIKLHKHKMMSRSHRSMRALIKGCEGNRILCLWDFKDLFCPQSSLNFCPLCRQHFENGRLYRNHLKSVQHFKVLQMVAPKALSVKRGTPAGKALAELSTDDEADDTPKLKRRSSNPRR